ncbi:hypothetical protein [Sporosarcina obsidiansis]|uniref:hypothetical protein n=1 Tax=Sporosarcina obsidiansis TaxID=2660748 RepID=UPI00129B74EB|nr:hypothetical protein [Sporosarcina obsidiansis]
MSTEWRGLLQKEWILLKWVVGWIVLLNVLVICVAPSLISSWAGIPGKLYENTHVLAGTWFAFYTFAGVAILFISLTKEMKSPEIWLHSPRSMFQLVGAKLVSATVIATGTLFFGGLLLSVALYFLGEWTIGSAWQGLLALLSILLSISLKLIFLMAVGLFFWSLYQMIRSRTSFFSVPITVFLFSICGFLWEWLRVAGFFNWLRSLLPLKLTDVTFYNEQTSYFFTGFVPNGIMFSIGSLVFYFGLSFLLVLAGSWLYEKKVRF